MIMRIVAGFFGFICLLCILGIVYVLGTTAYTVYNDPRSIGEQIGAFGGNVVGGFENSTNPQ